MKQIPLTQGKVALVNDEDYDWLNQWKWHAYKNHSTYYAGRNSKPRGNSTIHMHRVILGLTKGDGKITDHINRDGLDNRRANLRVVDYVISNRNHSGRKNNTSGHNGVHWHKQCRKWRAEIKVNSKRIYLGLFSNINDAIDARKQGELEYWT